MLTAEIWPTLDYSRVPYRLYHDAEAYEREQERIFRGPTWHFLALAAEIPANGDFRATQVGDTPVIVNRDDVVVVYRGVLQESYSCAPKCERRVTLGDAPAHFDAALGQIVTRSGTAQGQALPK